MDVIHWPGTRLQRLHKLTRSVTIKQVLHCEQPTQCTDTDTTKSGAGGILRFRFLMKWHTKCTKTFQSVRSVHSVLNTAPPHLLEEALHLNLYLYICIFTSLFIILSAIFEILFCTISKVYTWSKIDVDDVDVLHQNYWFFWVQIILVDDASHPDDLRFYRKHWCAPRAKNCSHALGLQLHVIGLSKPRPFVPPWLNQWWRQSAPCTL